MENPVSDSRPFNLFSIVACAIAAGYVGALILLFVRHRWIVGPQRRPIVTDFMEVWVAGRFALSGAAVTAYDWHAHHAGAGSSDTIFGTC